MDNAEYFISWGSERSVPLQRFESLQPHLQDQIRYHGEVLETAQTFTQHSPKHTLKSYDMERSLRKIMGRDPSCLDEDADSTSICWLDIVRHGDFQEQSDGYYHCSVQGKVFVHDQEIQDKVEFCKNHAIHISNSGPSHEDMQREVEVSMEILADMSNQLKCPYFLSSRPCASGSLTETAMKIRLRKLLSLRGAALSSEQQSSSSGSSSSSDSSGSETTSDADCDRSVVMSLDAFPKEASEDESEDKSMGDESGEDEGTGDDSSRNDATQQRNNNSENGGNAALDNGTVVLLDLASSTTPSSMPLIAEDENVISTDHTSLSRDSGETTAMDSLSLRNPRSVSSPTENQNGAPMDSVSSRNRHQVDIYHSHSKSPMRDGRNTHARSEGQSSRRPKRQKIQKKQPKSNRLSTYDERSIAIAWMKTWIEDHAGEKWTKTALQKDYATKFEPSRSYTTLETWRNKRENPQAKSHTVVLKIPAPRLREALSNDNSLQPMPGLSNGITNVPPSLQHGPSERPQNWSDSDDATDSEPPTKIESGLPNLLDSSQWSHSDSLQGPIWEETL
ncbi:hypothetical protein N7491_000069 [Penicillium cf. griseofulvum]|uniref:Uncharacterized protein n=1 Tax=Penicillium cf. griseofulvum TaxID=2972120 RepID=A0A9W9MF01_9EURO|nr:hypothetical protein N7472_004578 [Penicillium cf. griseofulvum]KAJ5450887.1 hypothetical protein N7491_000069 [Penicillium cf. griseofulvum]